MNASARTDADRIAAHWLARRDGEAWSQADAAALEAWLNAAVAHRVAFLRLQAAWDESRRLQALGAGRKFLGPPPRGHWSQVTRGLGVTPIESAGAPIPAPADAGEQAPAARLRPQATRMTRVLAVLSICAFALLAGWGWQTYNRVSSSSHRTMLGGLETLSLADGSTTTLASDSRIDVHLSRRERRIELQYGEAIFDVAKETGRPFVVDTGALQVVAVGTRFSVRRDARDLRVVVTEGTVRLQSRAGGTAVGPTTLLPAGSVALVRDDDVLVRSVPIADAERLLDWREGLLVFRDNTLAEAAAEFNRYNTRKLLIADDAVGALRIGGSFRWDNAEGFVRLLERGFPVRAEATTDGIELRTP